jgi:hypothetical protein
MSLAIAIPLTGCVVPIPADVEQSDGGTNSAPVILSSTPSMPGFDPISVTMPQMRSITVKDNDIGDTIYVRVFRDYQLGPQGPLNDQSVTNDPVNGTAIRVISLPTDTWCNAATLGDQHVFDVMVADRPFDSNPATKPEYRALPPDAEYSIRSWVATCTNP